MNKKIVVAGLAVVALALGAYAGPHGGPRGFCGPRGGFHHPPAVRHGFHHGHGWGHGGGHFWPGFVGGVVGGLVYDAVTTPYYRSSVVVSSPTVVAAPTVVTTPTVVAAPAVVTQPTVVAAPAVVAQPTVVSTPVAQTQNVWIEGRYVDQVQANGTVVRVWQPGHYEQRTIVVQ